MEPTSMNEKVQTGSDVRTADASETKSAINIAE